MAICKKCLEKIKVKAQFFCPACGTSNFEGRVCASCGEKIFLDGAVSLGDYQDKILQAAIIEYKYNFKKDVFVIFKKIIVDFCNNYHQHIFWRKDFNWLLVPVPLHKKREWERGFNQAEETAKILSFCLGLGADFAVLKKIKKTSRQAELNRLERLKNPVGAFTAKRKIDGQNIILVDDVFTTGATLNECAKILKQAGAGLVWAITLARER